MQLSRRVLRNTHGGASGRGYSPPLNREILIFDAPKKPRFSKGSNSHRAGEKRAADCFIQMGRAQPEYSKKPGHPERDNPFFGTPEGTRYTIVWASSSRRPANVRRTFAFYCSSPKTAIIRTHLLLRTGSDYSSLVRVFLWDFSKKRHFPRRFSISEQRISCFSCFIFPLKKAIASRQSPFCVANRVENRPLFPLRVANEAPPVCSHMEGFFKGIQANKTTKINTYFYQEGGHQSGSFPH